MGKLQFLLNRTYENISRNTTFASVTDSVPHSTVECASAVDLDFEMENNNSNNRMMMMMSADGSRLEETNTAANTVLLYVVQKRWYAGPNVKPPVDYMRLLSTHAEAEQVAYSSAHRYCTTIQQSGTSQKAVVRTIQLPHDMGLGFVAAGQLFWVRSMPAVAVGPMQHKYGEAHCIVSNNLLDPSANRRSHAATDNPAQQQYRIFVGPHSSHAALKLIHSGTMPPGSAVQWIPVGMPPSLEQLSAEWPDSASFVQQPIVMMDDSVSSKRSSSSGSTNENNGFDQEWWFYGSGSAANTDTAAGAAKEDTAPPAKRTCRPMSTQNAFFFNGLNSSSSTVAPMMASAAADNGGMMVMMEH